MGQNFGDLRFRNNDVVEIHSLGPTAPEIYSGVIKGIAADFGDDPATVYIVELTKEEVNKLHSNYPFSFVCIPQACLRRK